MTGIKKIAALVLLCLASYSLSLAQVNEKQRFEKWPPYMAKMRENCIKHSMECNLDDVNAYFAAAGKSKIKDCISWGYFFKIYYYTSISPQIDSAEHALSIMEREKMNETDIVGSKFNIISYYQFVGNPVKAVALCRSILNTSKDKPVIVEANFNILLLYYSLGMYKQAAAKAIGLCDFCKQITNKESYHYNLANIYSCAAEYLVCDGKFKEALPYLKKCDSTLAHDGMYSPAVGNNDMRFATITWCKYYLGINDLKNEKLQIKKLKSYKSAPLTAYSYQMEAEYYLKLKEYSKANEARNKMVKAFNDIGQDSEDVRSTMMGAQISKGLGDYKTACAFYEKGFSKNDSLRRQADELKTSEYAVKLNLNKAEIEKSELKAKAEHYHLQLVIMVMIITLIVFAAAVILIFYLRKMNRKLNSSNLKLKKAYDHVERLNKMKNEFIHNISHEIRTPLNSIVGFSQMIESEDEGNKQYSALLRENSNRLLHIVDNMLNISDIESCSLDTSSVNINGCCIVAMKAISEALSGSVKLIYEPSDTKLVINTNKDRLTQVISHILENAAKFTKSGTITLGYVSESSPILDKSNTQDKFHSDCLHIYVKDTGPGIPEDKTEWVFERFTKINNFVWGNGLGLSICKTIINRLGGTISIDSSYKDGCKIDIFLPR